MINFDFDQNQTFKPKIDTKMNPHESVSVVKQFLVFYPYSQSQTHICTVQILTVRFVQPNKWFSMILLIYIIYIHNN